MEDKPHDLEDSLFSIGDDLVRSESRLPYCPNAVSIEPIVGRL